MAWDTGAGGGASWDEGGASNTFGEPVHTGFDAGYGAGQGEDGYNGQGDGDVAGGRSGACFNCGEEGHMKGDCPQPAKARPCFNCGEEGHNKTDCPNPAKLRPCYNCGEEGHNKAECPNPAVAREFTGTCRLCEQQGHRASDCPTRPPTVCNNCKEEGHEAAKCEKPRKINRDHIEDVLGEVAWEQVLAAVKDKDLDDVKAAVEKYVKANPDITYVGIEKAFRNHDLPIFLIATEKELGMTYTNMDLQGNLDRQYTVTFRWSDKPLRPREKDGWPSSPEENIERLTNAGEPIDRGIPKCNNCDQLGHTSKGCPEEKMENADRAVVKCYNCDELGHRVRDCPNPRPDKFACRNCKQSGHSSKECPEPRSADGVECKKCGEVGHFSRDCPTGGGSGACHNCGEEGHRKQDCTNPRKIVCRNCDAEGHESRECPEPKDWSRVKCSNCEQMGHTKVRCKQPLKDAEGAAYGGDANYGGAGDSPGGDANYDGAAGFFGGDDSFNAEASAAGGDTWGGASSAEKAGW